MAHADATATRLLAELVACCAARGQQLVFTRVRRGELLAGLGAALDPRFARHLHLQPQLDLGLEWCEQRLLQRWPVDQPAAGPSPLAAHRLCEGLSDAELALLSGCVEHLRFEPGAQIVRRGEPAAELFILLEGQVSVTVDLPQGGTRRLSTLVAGMLFGETALAGSRLRTADVRADTAVHCCTLSTARLAQLESEAPALALRLLHNVLRHATEVVAHLTTEVAALEA